MALSPTDLSVFDVPINDKTLTSEAILDYKDVEALIKDRAEDIHSTKGLERFFEDLHATFEKDSRIVHQLSDEALAIYFGALEAAQGKFLSDDITKVKPRASKARFTDLPEL